MVSRAESGVSFDPGRRNSGKSDSIDRCHPSTKVRRLPVRGTPALQPTVHLPTLREILCLFALVLIVYLLNGHAIGAGDATPNRYLRRLASPLCWAAP